MTSAADTIQRLAGFVGSALAPLVEGLSGDDEIVALAASLGYELPAVPPSLSALHANADAMLDALADAEAAARDLEEGTGAESAVLQKLGLLILRIAAFAVEVSELGPKLRAELPAGFVNASGIADHFERRLLDAAVVLAVDQASPPLHRGFQLLGIIQEDELEADTTKAQPDFVLRELHLERIGTLFKDPAQLAREVYGWGTPALNVERLFFALEQLSFALFAPAERGYASDALLSALELPIPTDPEIEPPRTLKLSFLTVPPLDVGVVLFPLPTATPTEQQGLGLTVALAVGGGISIPLSRFVTLALEGELDLGAGLAIAVRPDRPPELIANLAAPVVITGGRAAVALSVKSPEGPLSLLSFPGGSRIEVQEVKASAGVEIRSGQPDVTVGAKLNGGRIVITLSGADGFLAKVLPPDGLAFDFDFGVAWSQKNGLRFEGSGGIEVTLALNLQLGPILLQSLTIALKVSDEGLTLELGATGGVTLGPVAASVDRIGVKGLVAFESGNLGPVDLGLGFKPPNGLGLAIQAGPVSGGGYIFLDYDLGRYAGVLQLQVVAVNVTAIGLLDTKLPDGRPGYSFLIIISTEFSPIQLGYGFTLNGVGGIAGINRTLEAEALRAGIYSGSLDHILFPKDPIRNAPQLISDLSRIFPPVEGQYTFGPMAKLGWGTPTLIEISLGIIIELPNPVRIALLGQIGMFLPKREAAVVEIHVDFVAIIDFGGKLLSLDATLRDSRIVVWTLTGDMALRLSWGDPPNFAVALGGFHPHFPPPPGFPALRRLQLAIGAGDYIRITCQSYQALTTNSLQFGARAELYVDVGVYVKGWFGFDALFVFSPFSFQVDFSAGLEVGVGGLQLAGVNFDGTLFGPTPWRVRGEATLSVLFFEVTAHVDEKFGSEEKAELAPADPWPPLQAALVDARNWAAALPGGAAATVGLAAPKGSADVLLDPCGRMTWRQKVVPLDRTVTRFGNAPTPAPVQFNVDRVKVSGTESPHQGVTDFFAAAQSQELSDAEKLSRPSFEPMTAGVEVGGAAVRLGPPVPAEIVYETRIIDSELESRVSSRFQLSRWTQLALHATGARSELLAGGMQAFAGKRILTQQGDGFAVVSTVDLSKHATIGTARSKGAAADSLARYLADHPAERGRWQIIPEAEAEAA